MHAANELVGDERYDAVPADRARPRPRRGAVGGMRTYNNRYLFSRRMGCQHYQGAYGIDFAQLCVRPAITTDDTRRRYRARARSSSTFPSA